MPKPNGMLALNYRPPIYHQAPVDCPFTFDINSLSSIEIQPNCFFSLSYPSMKAKVYMSYFNLNKHQIEDLYRDFNARLLEHTKQEARIQESSYENANQQKYGRFFEITSNAPSNLHYLLTDQKNHFMSGVLFFSATPNYDSLFPAIQYIKNDLRHLTESLDWR
jgi:gliding motility-associated lipoprotein GldD